MKALCWTIVIAGWVLYGLIILVTLIHPPAHQTNPVEDIQHLFSSESMEHWRTHLVLLGLAVLYFSAWAYTRKDNNE